MFKGAADSTWDDTPSGQSASKCRKKIIREGLHCNMKMFYLTSSIHHRNLIMDQLLRAIAERVKTARLNCGLTQDAAAEQLGIPRPSYTLLEQGKRKVDSVELVRLGRILGQPISYFLETQEPDAQEGNPVLLRGDLDTEEEKACIAGILFRVRELRELQSLLGIAWKPDRSDFTSMLRGTAEPVSQGSRIAGAARRSLDLGSAPLTGCSLLAERLKIALVMRPLPEFSLDGFSYSCSDHGDCMFINTAASRERQRFTFAHELGHVLMDVGHTGTVVRRTRTPAAPTETAFIEKRANAFAACLLMPSDGLLQALEGIGFDFHAGDVMTSMHVEQLRRYFGVSYDAMCWRLYNERIITSRDREELLKHASTDQTSLFNLEGVEEAITRYALQAWSASHISIGRLSEYLRKDIHDTRKLAKKWRKKTDTMEG